MVISGILSQRVWRQSVLHFCRLRLNVLDYLDPLHGKDASQSAMPCKRLTPDRKNSAPMLAAFRKASLGLPGFHAFQMPYGRK
jgi:hypothetical protein